MIPRMSNDTTEVTYRIDIEMRERFDLTESEIRALAELPQFDEGDGGDQREYEKRLRAREWVRLHPEAVEPLVRPVGTIVREQHSSHTYVMLEDGWRNSFWQHTWLDAVNQGPWVTIYEPPALSPAEMLQGILTEDEIRAVATLTPASYLGGLRRIVNLAQEIHPR